MSTLAELAIKVRRSLKDFPKWRTDTGAGDGATAIFDLGKDLSVLQASETVSLAGVPKVRGVDYTIDYDANQIVFTAAPGNGVAIRAQYREAVIRDELVFDAVNAGRRMLFPKFYAPGAATITIRNNVRTYQLDGADVNEGSMRAVFGQGPGTFKILNGRVQPYGAAVDQLWTPFRKFYQEWSNGHPMVHCWRLLGINDIFKINVIYGFMPLTDPSQQSDIPDRLEELVTLWATSTLALKQEPQRARSDTANVQQSNFATPPGTMSQTAEDFIKKWEIMFKAINSEPPTFEVRDMPLPWESGYRGYV